MDLEDERSVIGEIEPEGAVVPYQSGELQVIEYEDTFYTTEEQLQHAARAVQVADPAAHRILQLVPREEVVRGVQGLVGQTAQALQATAS